VKNKKAGKKGKQHQKDLSSHETETFTKLHNRRGGRKTLKKNLHTKSRKKKVTRQVLKMSGQTREKREGAHDDAFGTMLTSGGKEKREKGKLPG